MNSVYSQVSCMKEGQSTAMLMSSGHSAAHLSCTSRVYLKQTPDKCNTLEQTGPMWHTNQRCGSCNIQAMLSMRDALISLTMLLGWLSLNLKTFSTTDSSVAVVSSPQNADQSLQTKPAPTTSLPLLTVPATSGTCSREASSSKSSTDVCG